MYLIGNYVEFNGEEDWITSEFRFALEIEVKVNVSVNVNRS